MVITFLGYGHNSTLTCDENNDLYDFLQFSGSKKEDLNMIKFGMLFKNHLEMCPGLVKKKTKVGVTWEIDRQVSFDWLLQKSYTCETELSPVIETQYSSDW